MPVLVPVVVAAMVVLVAACTTTVAGEEGSGSITTIEDYPDAKTRALRRLAAAPRPVPRSALPPRHLDAERFPQSLVDRTLIVSGGVTPDAIASIDQPRFEPVADVDWLADDEAVLVLDLEGRPRAYPIQIMILHEIVNDVVGERPVTVTYCPLCNSGVAFDRRVEGEILDFGTSGSLYQSALVMYDRQTESLWTHFDGRAVVGDHVGAQLELLPLATVAWHDFRQAHPGGEVLGRFHPALPYGTNPYGSYDSSRDPLAGFFRGDVDGRLPPMARVVGLQVDGSEIAVPLDQLRDEHLVSLEVDGRRAVVVWTEGATSALDANRVDEGFDLGATGAFWTDRPLTRPTEPSPAALIDSATGERWSVLGTPLVADGGPLPDPLEPIVHLDTFWFAWSTHHPSTDIGP